MRSSMPVEVTDAARLAALRDRAPASVRAAELDHAVRRALDQLRATPASRPS